MSLLRYKKDQKILTWDYESVSLNLMSLEVQSPWQLGWMVTEGNKTLIEREDWILWDNLVEMMGKWGKGAAAVTGWTEYEYLQKAQPAEPILDEFEKYLYDPNVISLTSNGWNFDIYLHNIYRKRLGRQPDWSFLSRLVDIQTLSKAAHLGVKPPPIGGDDWIFFNIKMSNYHKKGLKTNLAFMCKDLGVDSYDPDRHHREALFDVQMTYQCFQKQIQKMDITV